MKHVLTALVICFCFSLVSELGSYWWVFDLFSHWRAHYILIGLLLTLSAWYFKKWRLVFAASSVVIVHLIAMLPYLNLFRVPMPVQADSSETVTVAFINTYWKSPNMDSVVAAITEIDPDVIFLEEIQPDQFTAVKDGVTGYGYSYHESVPFSFDMGVLSKLSVESTQSHVFARNDPALEIVVNYQDKKVRFIGVHPYSPVSAEYTKLRNEYLRKLFEYTTMKTETTIIGGDFNISQYSPEFKEITQNSRLVDTQKDFRLQNTWPSHFPSMLAIPIDQVFVSPDVAVVARFRGPRTSSDHWPIVVKVRL